MLPKFILYLTLCTSLVTYHFGTLSNPRLEQLGHGYIQIYSTDSIHSPLATRQQIATGYIYTTKSCNAEELRNKLTHIDGESIVLDTAIPAREILRILGYSIVGVQNTAQTQITYAFSNRARDYITSNNTKINLQIAVTGDRVTVGWQFTPDRVELVWFT